MKCRFNTPSIQLVFVMNGILSPSDSRGLRVLYPTCTSYYGMYTSYDLINLSWKAEAGKADWVSELE